MKFSKVVRPLLSPILWLTVIVPTGLASIYFGLIASDIYLSESRFVVRSPERASASAIGNLLQGVGFSRAQDESYTVQDFILSRDALADLEKRQKLSQAYSRKDIDFLSRFGALTGDTSFEALHRYYKDKVQVKHDGTSSITTLVVKAFSAQEAHAINQRLILISEELVNGLNNRGREDALRYALQDVSLAEEKAKSASLALFNFRESASVVDPERQAAAQLGQVIKLQDELTATRLQLGQVVLVSPDNPQINVLRTRITALQNEISRELGDVTTGTKSLVRKATQFQRLALDRDFAEKQLAAAQVSLENARMEARKKQVYLERLVAPMVPDVATEPKRLKSVISVFFFGLLAWGVLTMMLAGVREHRD